MDKTIHLLPLTHNEVILIVTALTAMLAAYESPQFMNALPSRLIDIKRKETREILKKLQNLK